MADGGGPVACFGGRGGLFSGLHAFEEIEVVVAGFVEVDVVGADGGGGDGGWVGDDVFGFDVEGAFCAYEACAVLFAVLGGGGDEFDTVGVGEFNAVEGGGVVEAFGGIGGFAFDGDGACVVHA